MNSGYFVTYLQPNDYNLSNVFFIQIVYIIINYIYYS